MTVDVQLPNADILVVGSAPTQHGGSSNYGILSDSSTSTWLQWFANSAVTVGVPLVTLAAGEQMRQYRVVVKMTQGAGNINTYVNAQDASGVNGAADYYNTVSSGGFATYYGAWRNAAPNGGVLIPSSVARIVISDNNGGTTSPQVADAWIEVQTNFAPVPTATGPSGTVSTTQTPSVTASFTDAEGDALERVRIKVFNSAQYAAGGFDPNTSTPFVDSGEMFTNSVNWTVATPLPNDTYRAFIFVADAGSNGHYNIVTTSGPYASWTESITLPAAPTMIATDDSANARVQLIVTGHDTSPTGQHFEIDRSVDSGITWTPLKRAATGGSPWVTSDLSGVVPVSQSVTAYDYEVPPMTTVQYRARTTFLLGGTGAPVWGPYTAIPNILTTASYGWRLKQLANPANNWQFHPALSDLEFHLTYDEAQGVDHPLGRSRETVTSDSVTGAHVPWDALMLSDTEYASYTTLRTAMTPMLLQAPWGEQWYVRFTGQHSVMRVVDGDSTEVKRTASALLTEIDMP